MRRANNLAGDCRNSHYDENGAKDTDPGESVEAAVKNLRHGSFCTKDSVFRILVSRQSSELRNCLCFSPID
jgi:hypothetical protein